MTFGDNRQPVSEELAEELRLLDNRQELLRALFLGISLQYRSLDVQRCLLLRQQDPGISCGELTPLALQNAAYLIILCVLLGFQKQIEDLVRQSADAGSCPDLTDAKLGATSIAVTLIRLFRLNRNQGNSSGTSGNAFLSEDTTNADI